MRSAGRLVNYCLLRMEWRLSWLLVLLDRGCMQAEEVGCVLAGAPVTPPPGDRSDAQSAQMDMANVVWPMPRVHTSAAAQTLETLQAMQAMQAMPSRHTDPGAGQGAFAEMHHAVWPAPRIRTAASNSLPIGDPGACPAPLNYPCGVPHADVAGAVSPAARLQQPAHRSHMGGVAPCFGPCSLHDTRLLRSC